MLRTGTLLKQAGQSRGRDVSTPVSRSQRMTRLEKAPDQEHEAPEERLRRFARRVDTWSESRSDKSIWQSWVCT